MTPLERVTKLAENINNINDEDTLRNRAMETVEQLKLAGQGAVEENLRNVFLESVKDLEKCGRLHLRRFVLNAEDVLKLREEGT